MINTTSIYSLSCTYHAHVCTTYPCSLGLCFSVSHQRGDLFQAISRYADQQHSSAMDYKPIPSSWSRWSIQCWVGLLYKLNLMNLRRKSWLLMVSVTECVCTLLIYHNKQHLRSELISQAEPHLMQSNFKLKAKCHTQAGN